MIHPCETSSAMKDLLESAFESIENGKEPPGDGGCEEAGLVRWLEVWFMLVGSVVDLVSL